MESYSTRDLFRRPRLTRSLLPLLSLWISLQLSIQLSLRLSLRLSICISSCLLFAITSNYAVSDEGGYQDITSSFSVFYAPVGEFQPSQFYSADRPGQFQPLNPPTNVTRANGEAWLLASITPPTSSSTHILEIPGQLFNYIDVWFRLPDGSIIHDQAGVRYPYSSRSVKHSNVAFILPAASGGDIEVLIRARNDTPQPINFAAWIWPEEQWSTYILGNRFWYGIFIGAVLILCIYNAFLAVTLRDISYLFYVGYVFCLSFSVLQLGGLAEEYFWPEGNPLELVLALSGLGAFLGVCFVNIFLKVRTSYPGVFAVSTGVGLLTMLCGLTLIGLPSLPFVPGGYSASVVHALTLCCSLYFIVISLYSYFRGYTPARFLALSMTFLLVSLFIYFAYTHGFLRYNLYLGHLMELGTLAEGILLSLALADRINLLSRQKHAAEREAMEYHRDFSKKLISAQEKERQVLSETMHDSIGHAMLVLKHNLENSTELLSAESGGASSELRDMLQEQTEYCGEIMHDVRRISHDLHPHMLKRLGLPAAIESTLGRALDPLNIRWSADIDPDCRKLDMDTQTIVYRAVQECLNNIMKYARATEVSCELVCDGNTLKACVYDNGAGFDTKTNGTGENTLGLEELSGRIRVAGGSMSVDSAPGEGTAVSFELPLLPDSREGETSL
jgi:two-component system, sensor histidine kinase LadS